jgi:hypothetical protein
VGLNVRIIEPTYGAYFPNYLTPLIDSLYFKMKVNKDTIVKSITMKSRKVRWLRHVASMEKWNSLRVLLRNPKEKRQL